MLLASSLLTFKTGHGRALVTLAGEILQQGMEGHPADVILGDGQVMIPFEGGAQRIQGFGFLNGQSERIP